MYIGAARHLPPSSGAYLSVYFEKVPRHVNVGVFCTRLIVAGFLGDLWAANTYRYVTVMTPFISIPRRRT